MSHITHFYHLAALDYLDVLTATAGTGGPSVVMPPWTPYHRNTDSIGDIQGNPTVNTIRDVLVGHYVEALSIRRKAHIAAAEVDGKHPCQNAQVPGGMTTKPSRVNWANVLSLLTDIRKFINTKYIPDLLSVALIYGSPALLPVATIGVWPKAAGQGPNLFLQGYGCGNLLAYGAFTQPQATGNQKLFSQGRITVPAVTGVTGTYPNITLTGGLTTVVAPSTVDVTQIIEHVNNSKYSSPTKLHPSVGQTTPDFSAGYTWHKAPRYGPGGTSDLVYEVGPLARMVVNAMANNPTAVSDKDLVGFGIPQDTVGFTLGTVTGLGSGSTPAIGPLDYTCQSLVTAVLLQLQTALGCIAGGVNYALLMSVLGRHAARALECKYLADALACGASVPLPTKLTPGPTYPNCTAGIPIINNVILDPNPNSDVYTYQVMPKAFKMGYGLTEAPRGALGHWITTEFRRIVNYQCVVPSTWNASGKDDNNNMGPIEQSLLGLNIGDPLAADPAGTTSEMISINRLLRAIHPFDICVACSVHVADTKGNNLLKFTMDPDGKVTQVEKATKED